MPLATSGAILQDIENCYIQVGDSKVTARILPEITDSKSASYSDEPVIGRSFPVKTFGHGDNRIINIKWHFVLLEDGDADEILDFLRTLQGLVYPQSLQSPYAPPIIANIKCGNLINDADDGLCAVLKSYSVTFPTDVPWDEDTYIPYKFDIDLNFDIVFSTDSLPGSELIMSMGV